MPAMVLPYRLLALVLALSFLAISCGGGSSDPDGGSGSNGGEPSPTVVSRAVADEEYLAVMCTGLERFSTAIATETTAAGISAVIVEFTGELEAIDPPTDVVPFHEAFIAFLEEAVDDPTRPLVVAPPLPSDEVRDRLGAKERGVAECREPTFFGSVPAER